MEDLGQIIGLLAIAGFTGWITVDSVVKGEFSWHGNRWSRSQNPIPYYMFTMITAGLCLLALRVIVFGLFGV